MTIEEMNRADAQVIALVNAAYTRRRDELVRLISWVHAKAIDASRRKKARHLRRVLWVAVRSLFCFLVSLVSIAAMEAGVLSPIPGVIGMVIPSLIAARIMIRSTGRC